VNAREEKIGATAMRKGGGSDMATRKGGFGSVGLCWHEARGSGHRSGGDGSGWAAAVLCYRRHERARIGGSSFVGRHRKEENGLGPRRIVLL
jgi:hypothetical protein